MMESELRALLKEFGLTLSIRKRGKRLYAFAQRIEKQEYYLTPMEKLDQLTTQEVLKKIKVS